MKSSLQSQIMLALLLFAGLFVVVLAANQALFQRVLADQQPLALAREVTARAQDLEHRARTYAEVAPRNYRDYDRDVLVYYDALRFDLEQLDQAMRSLESTDIVGNGSRAAIESMTQVHDAFVAGLWDKLGENLAEPRLEWGAQYLSTEAPRLREAAQATQSVIVDFAGQHVQSAHRLAAASWLLGLLTVAGIALWFWLRVARRIGLAARRCTAVAEGEFGLRIDDGASDELGAFARSFNTLSARTRVVLGVLDRLPPDAGPEQAFSALWDEGRGYLGHAWQALFVIDPTLSSGRMQMVRQDDGAAPAAAGKPFALAGITQTLGLTQHGAALMPDLRRHTLDAQQGQLLRELSRHGLRTLALVLLRDSRGKAHGILAFGWRGADAENAGIARFLQGLTRFLARALIPEPRPTTANG